jgi:PAS domain S-box-containing protein
MSAILIIAILLSTGALGWALVLFYRRRVIWLAALGGVVALMLVRQIWTLLLEGLSTPLSLTARPEQLPDLALGAVALLVVGFIHRHTRHVKRVAATLPIREPHWRALIENALDRDVIAVLNEDARIQYVNPPAEVILGYGTKELRDRVVFELIHPDDRPQVQEVFTDCIRKPGPAPKIEFRIRRKDGADVWFEAVGNNLLGDPELQCVVVSCRDISDRRVKEAEVRDAWIQTQQFLNASEVMFVALDQDGKITLVNRKAIRLLGYRHARELIGVDWFATCIPDSDEADAKAVFTKLMSGEAAPTAYHENLVRTQDERQRLIAWHDVVLRGTDGAPTGTLSAGEDITDRRAVEDELLKFRMGIERSSDIVFLTDVDGNILYANPAFERVYGHRPEDVIGQNPRILKSGIVPPEVYHQFWQALLAKEVVTGEIVNQAKDGTLVTVEVSVSPTIGEDGNIIGYLAIQHDVTERKATEDALRRSETSYRELVEHAVYGVYRSTPDGRFLSVNPALVQILGYDSAEELLSVDMAVDIYASQGQRARMVERYGGQQLVEGLEVDWKRKDDSRVTVRLSGRPILDEAGKVKYVEMLVEDVTERRALEQQLQHAQKLEAIGQLTAGIAHDFNNILTTIIASSELAAQSLSMEQEEVHADLEEITGAARRAAEMIKKLMAFGRREHLELEPIDLEPILHETASMMKRVLPENIELRLRVGQGCGLVQGNRGAIEQILLNMGANARDAMPQGGKLTVSLTRFLIDDEYRRRHGWGKPGFYVLLSITDSGTGMDARTQARIFEPFFTTKSVGRGTGLGLAMVYGLIKQHGGYIDLYSELGRGTTFNLYFPITEEIEQADRPTATAQVQHGAETILVVEDEEAIRRSAQRILERYGYRVLAAADGQQAMAFLQKHSGGVDLVVTDVVMPNLGGVGLYEQTRQAGSGVRFLFTSGYMASEVLDPKDGEPTPQFLRKPWTVTDLVTKVREVLDTSPSRVP